MEDRVLRHLDEQEIYAKAQESADIITGKK
jgi:hypothetical protein